MNDDEQKGYEAALRQILVRIENIKKVYNNSTICDIRVKPEVSLLLFIETIALSMIDENKELK